MTQEQHDEWCKKPVSMKALANYSHILRPALQSKYGLILRPEWLVSEHEFQGFKVRWPGDSVVLSSEPDGNETPDEEPEQLSLF